MAIPVVIVFNLIVLYFGYVVESGGHLSNILRLVDPSLRGYGRSKNDECGWAWEGSCS